MTAEGLYQGHGGVEPGRDGEVGHVQHKVEECGISAFLKCPLVLPVVVIEVGYEPAGLHQLVQGGAGVVPHHLGPGDVSGSWKGHLHQVRSKRRFAELLS